MAKKSGSGGWKRSSTTSRSGVRRTTTHNRSTGTTRSMSVPNGKYNRTTYSTTPKGQTKITRTQKSASGYITRTTQTLGKTTKPKKPPKPKAYKPPKAPKMPKIKTIKTKAYKPKTYRRRRSSGGNGGCAVILLAPFAFTLLTYGASMFI